MDLADAGSPEMLVRLILKGEPDLPCPVPIENLCVQLDIESIEVLEIEQFEGGLITDPERSSGVILIRDGVFPSRRRFTIAHELGHFLMPTHVPDAAGRFLCSKADLGKLSAGEGDRRARMEVEANRFASLILMPPPLLRAALRSLREPDLEHIPALARQFGVSKEAMARAYAEYHEQDVAIIVVRHGTVQRLYHRRTGDFPYIQVRNGNAVPQASLLHRGGHQLNIASSFAECLPDLWIEVRRGERAPAIFEQVYLQRDGLALMLLHLVRPDEEEEAEERELQQSWSYSFSRSRRR